ncbi:MAG: hypothetical protein WA066_03010 [Candidatus Omnitrophota bacterium]
MTDISICNLALSEIGENQITAFSDKSNINLENIYKSVRDEVLLLHPWDFAIKRTRLTAKGLLDCSARTIAFVVSSLPTITDSGNGFLTAGFEAGDIVNVSGSGSNNTSYKIDSVAAGTLTLESFEIVIAETLVNDADLKLYAQPAYLWSFKYDKPSELTATFIPDVLFSIVASDPDTTGWGMAEFGRCWSNTTDKKAKMWDGAEIIILG